MSDKISKKLTMGERFMLLGILPPADFVTHKILRKLRDTLAPSEEEIRTYGFLNQYQCHHREYDEKGKAFQCEYVIESKEQPECPIHKEFMSPTNRISWSPEHWHDVKEIWFGLKANSIVIDALKAMPEEAKVGNTDLVLSLFEKFSDKEEETED